MRRSRSLLALAAAVACGAPPAAPPATGAPAGPPPPASTATPGAPAPVAGAAPAPPGPAPPPDPWAGTSFPPPDSPPLHPASAVAGDGHWVRLGDASRGDRAAQDPPPLFQATVHPHPLSRYKKVVAVAMDLKLLGLHLVAGTEDPESAEVPVSARPGTVAAVHRDSVVAVFNGGWQAKHGRWGMKIGEHRLLPPRADACTIAIYRDGRVRIAAWQALAPTEPEMAAYRQTPPCLLEGGELHPRLEAHDERPWGGLDPKIVTRRRSALAVDASGRVLLYGYGDEAGTRDLALGLRALGAVAAAKLDLNFHWVRFLLVGGPPGEPARITSTLVPQMPHRARGYVERPEPRDFFYVALRE
ncbi:MAG: hypothetical protein IT376_20675 [Polyangiaceae bacterium]|nr:hypothetical protein [Polyangiaceae bacterium]